MAATQLSDIGGVMTVVLQDRMEKQFRSDAVLLHLLRVLPGAGKNLSWDAKFDTRAAGGAYAEGADMTSSDFDTHARVQATLPWGQYRKGAKVTGLARAAAASVGPTHYAGLPDLLVEEVMDAVEDLALDVAADLYAGTGAGSPNKIAGAAIAIEDDDDDFAGITTSTYTTWAAGSATLSADSLSFSELRKKLFRPVKDGTGQLPDFVTVDGTGFDLLLDRFGDSAEPVSQIRTYANGVIALEQLAGTRAVSLDGVPFIEDRHCTAGTFYAWNSRYIRIRQLPDPDAQVDPSEVAKSLATFRIDVTPDDVATRLQAAEGRLIPAIVDLDRQGDSRALMVKLYLQLEWRRRNAFAKLTLT